MNVGDSDKNILPVVPEPFALIIGPRLHGADAGHIETAMRHMGLQPETLQSVPANLTDEIRLPCYRFRFGSVTVLAGPAADGAVAEADPADPATSLLAASLPANWQKTEKCWRFVPETTGAASLPQRDYLKLVVLAVDLFDASHFFWPPARLWSDASQLRSAVAEMMASSMPPVLHLVAFRRSEIDGADVVSTRGLALFSDQELRAHLPSGWTIADGVKRLARIAIDVILHGAIDGPQRIRGMTAGESIRLVLHPARAANSPTIVAVEFIDHR